MSYSPPALFEELEGRRLLHGDGLEPAAVDPSSAAARSRFAVQVNFGPASVPVRGYKSDYGATYGRRGNGLTYGWNSNHISKAAYNDDSRYDSARAETHVKMTKDSRWSIRVPNGYYDVRILMGDADTFNAQYRVNAEGKPVVKGEPFAPNFPWVEGLQTVQVRDGVLTLSSDAKSLNNIICSVRILGVATPTPVATGVKITWSNAGVKSPIYRGESGSIRVGNKLYVFGGFTNGYNSVTGRVDILDLRTNTWSKGRPLPGAQTHFGVATDGRNIFLAGGQYGPLYSTNGTNQVWRYDTQTNAWSAMPGLPEVRFGGQMQYIDGRLHFVGGNDATRVQSQSDHFIFDVNRSAKGWYVGAPLPMATDHHSSTVVNNQLYMLGGEVEHGTSYLTNAGMYRYNASANRWVGLADMPEGTSHVESATLTDGKRIFVIAGQVNAQQLTKNVYSYQIATNRWEQHTSLPTARKAGIAWMMGNKLYYSTGDDAETGETRSTYVGVIG